MTSTSAATARVPLGDPPGPFNRLLRWWSRRTYGGVLDNARAMQHHRRLLLTVVGFERRLARWDRLDETLKTLAVTAAAGDIGCSWCLDFGYFRAHHAGVDTSRLPEVPRWRESTAFTALERQVLAYAEAVTATPPEVTDQMAAGLRQGLGETAFVELTMMVAVENQRSRFNSALGLTSQGFSERCGLAP